MKVAHLVTARSWRGGEQQVFYLVEELNKKGIKQLVICTKGSEMERRCKKRGYPYASLKRTSSFDLKFAFHLKKEVKKFKADLLHMHDAHAHTAAIIASDLFRMKTPLILSRRVDFPVRDNLMSKYKYNHPRIKKIVCVSNTIMRITGASIKNKSVLTVVHSGVNPERFEQAIADKRLHREYNLDESIKIIGNTSAIANHKDYPTFLKVAEHFKDQKGKVVFLIIGDGPDRDLIKRQTTEMNLNELVIFTGFRNDIPQVLKELDVFLMPSKSEGLGTSLLDAMSCEVPIVSANAGGIPEIVENGVSGLLSEPGDHLGLAEQVRKLLEDEKFAQSIVDAASKKVKLFSSAAMAQNTLAVYQSI